MAEPRRRQVAPDTRVDIGHVVGFVNTLVGRGRAVPDERLASYTALVDWARASGMIDAATAAALRRQSAARAHQAEQALHEARALRETLHALFTAVAAGRRPAPTVLTMLGSHLSAGVAQARLVVQAGTLQWAPGTLSGLEDVTREIARAAARLVGSAELARMRACAAEDCRWWFVDDTRNHSRRWCEMKTCGNRAKVRRFRARP